MMSMTMRSLLIAPAFALLAIPAWAEPVLTFEGLKNHEPVADYYDGGKGSLGAVPARITGSRSRRSPGDRSRGDSLPGRSFAAHGAPAGRIAESLGARPSPVPDHGRPEGSPRSLIFYDIAILRPATVQIWSGSTAKGRCWPRKYSRPGLERASAAR